MIESPRSPLMHAVLLFGGAQVVSSPVGWDSSNIYSQAGNILPGKRAHYRLEL
jgi:hypothetical protein